jgi:hypothetical protein
MNLSLIDINNAQVTIRCNNISHISILHDARVIRQFPRKLTQIERGPHDNFLFNFPSPNILKAECEHAGPIVVVVDQQQPLNIIVADLLKEYGIVFDNHNGFPFHIVPARDDQHPPGIRIHPSHDLQSGLEVPDWLFHHGVEEAHRAVVVGEDCQDGGDLVEERYGFVGFDRLRRE